jgi:hypothetical protein
MLVMVLFAWEVARRVRDNCSRRSLGGADNLAARRRLGKERRA